MKCPHCQRYIEIVALPSKAKSKSQKYGPTWPLQRARAFERDGGKCQNIIGGRQCISRFGKILVHHIRPIQEFNGDTESANQLSNLITLCSTCHGAAHRALYQEKKRRMQELRQ